MTTGPAATTPPAAGLGPALRFAWRDLRGSLGGFAIFLACIALGVAAISAVGNLNAGVAAAFARDASALLGGDLQLEQAGVPVREEELAPLLPADARVSRVVRTSSLLEGPDGRRLPVTLKAVDDAYPLLGEVRLAPALPIGEVLRDGGVAVEAAVLARLGAKLGDTVRLGDATVRLAAVLEREPDRIGGLFAVGPRVLVSDELLAASGIVQPGALVRYEHRIDLPPAVDAERFARDLKAARPDAGWRVQTSAEVQPQVARLTDRLATFLSLAGLTALVIGGLGVAMAVQTHLARRTASIATLKCLGATGRQILVAYLAQIMLVAAVGSLLGLAGGWALLLALAGLADRFLPVRLDLVVDPAATLVAAGAGLLTALTFGLLPLLRARDVPPATVFRSPATPTRQRPRRADLVAGAACVLALAGLAVLGVPRPSIAAWFVLAVVVSLLVLSGLARLLLAGLGRLRPGVGPAPRLALANLRAGRAGAASVITALGAGLAALVTTTLLEANLNREVTSRVPLKVPALIFIDIQPGQRDAFAAAVASVPGATVLQEVPSLRARVVRIAGKPVEEAKVSPEVEWTLRRDRGLTYQAAPSADTRVVAGEWWPADYAGPPLLSLDEATARGYGVGLGDTLAFNVLGRNIETRVANLRQEVDWSNGRLDFLFVVSPGLLDRAPHTFVAAVEVPGGAGETALIEAVAKAAPNVTPIPVREAVRDLAASLRKIGLAVDAVAGFTLLAGLLVLAAAVAAVRERHRYQSVVLKVLGATRPLLLRAFLLEYGALGLLASAVGALLGTIAAWLLVTRLMDLEWSFAPLPVAGVMALALALSLGAGAIGLRRLLAQGAGAALRSA